MKEEREPGPRSPGWDSPACQEETQANHQDRRYEYNLSPQHTSGYRIVMVG